MRHTDLKYKFFIASVSQQILSHTIIPIDINCDETAFSTNVLEKTNRISQVGLIVQAKRVELTIILQSLLLNGINVLLKESIWIRIQKRSQWIWNTTTTIYL